ncbi:hypothetical protein LJB90_00360 [Eubacteriales bacterium OttesenSCG-928-G02]|nr:hypothetical protein [Eubacteriales bacterium OttesenSCG-928-G02]
MIKNFKKRTAFVSMLVAFVLVFSVLVPASAGFAGTADTAVLTLPEAMKSTIVSADQLSARLTDEEPDLNTLVFENKDGTKSAYIFSKPVKYIDNAGVVRDKSNAVSESIAVSSSGKYAYAVQENDVKTYFPSKITSSSGTVLQFNGNSVEVAPVFSESNVKAANQAQKTKNGSVEYSNVFGEFTKLRYTPTFEGFKEDIILDKNIGKYSFSFVIKTNGLKAEARSDGSVALYEKDKEVMLISPVVVYDSKGSFTRSNTIELEKRTDGSYLYTITADKAFLDNENTAYPVTIDPSYETTLGYSAIYDTPIYSGTPSSNYGTYMLATVGYLGTSGGVNYGVGRMLLKCPTLTSSTQAFNASNATVNSVNLYINEGSGKAASSTVTAYYYTGSSWSETGATYNNISWNGYNTSIASATINSSKLYSYNIKAAYTAWKNGSKSVDSGLMFKNSNESSSTYAKTFCTAEYSPTSQRPYIVVGYSTTNVTLNLDHTSYTLSYGTRLL